MDETMTDRRVCCAGGSGYCDRCDLLVGLDGLHVVSVAEDGERLVVTVQSPPARVGAAGTAG